MSIEDQLKNLIIARYGNVKAFTKEIGLANSTLASIFTRGVHNASVKNINKVCKALGISADGLVNNQIIPVDIESRDKWNFKDIVELTEFIKLTVKQNKTITIDEKPVSEAEIDTYIDIIEFGRDYLRKRTR